MQAAEKLAFDMAEDKDGNTTTLSISTHRSRDGQPSPIHALSNGEDFETNHVHMGNSSLAQSTNPPSAGPPAANRPAANRPATELATPLTKHSGASVATFFNGLFTTVLALATLGTSITFTFILSDLIPPPDDARYDVRDVSFFLAISWLLFLLALAIAATASTLLTFFKKHWVNDWDGRNGLRKQFLVQMYAVSISATMGGLVVAAFIFLCLVVVAYQSSIGWLSLAFTSFFGIVVIIGIAKQVPRPGRRIVREKRYALGA